jgi:hypothetical protein
MATIGILEKPECVKIQEEILESHAFPSDAKEFLETLDTRQKKLHELARSGLGSSYFMEKTNSYRAWKAKQGK